MTGDPSTIFDAARASGAREAMATALGTAGLREKGAEILGRSVYSARAASAAYAQKLRDVINALTQGDIGPGQARTALWEICRDLGYTPEGGFPDAPEPVPPAVAGSLQDLSSYQRRKLIVDTQLALMRGKGEQVRGMTATALKLFPAWRLVRLSPRMKPRLDWPARWVIAGGKPGPMVALKGDPVWGELGSSSNFDDALDTDSPPFAFNSGMGWLPVSAVECAAMGITGPDGMSIAEFFQTRPVTLAGKQPLPAPKISLAGIDPDIIRAFVDSTKAIAEGAEKFLYHDIIEKEVAASQAAYLAAHPGYDPEYGKEADQ